MATAATLAEPVAGPAYDSLPTPLAFGLVLLVVVAALGHVSGAHVNPAVTLGLATTGKFPWRYVPAYLVAQLLGALLGALGTWVAFGTPGREQASLAATAPTAGVGALQGLAVEAIVTFVLVFVIIRPVHRQGRRAGLRSGDPDARPREQDEGRTSGSSGARGTRRAPDAVWWSRRQHRQSEADADPRLSPNMRRRRVGFP